MPSSERMATGCQACFPRSTSLSWESVLSFHSTLKRRRGPGLQPGSLRSPPGRRPGSRLDWRVFSIPSKPQAVIFRTCLLRRDRLCLGVSFVPVLPIGAHVPWRRVGLQIRLGGFDSHGVCHLFFPLDSFSFSPQEGLVSRHAFSCAWQAL